MSYENQLTDEFTSAPKRAVQSTEQTVRLAEMIKRLFSNSATTAKTFKAPAANTNIMYCFSGQFTDLDFFSGRKTMPMSVMNNISDPKLKQAVIDNFERYAADGLVRVDNNTGTISITEKGEAYIADPTFKQSAAINQSTAYTQWLSQGLSAEESLCVELTGDSMIDFTAFGYTDSFDMQKIAACPNQKAVNQIFANIEKWKSEGLVSQGLGNTIKITEKGKEILSAIQQEVAEKAATTKALAAASGGNPVILAAVKSAQFVKTATQVQSR